MGVNLITCGNRGEPGGPSTKRNRRRYKTLIQGCDHFIDQRSRIACSSQPRGGVTNRNYIIIKTNGCIRGLIETRSKCPALSKEVQCATRLVKSRPTVPFFLPFLCPIASTPSTLFSLIFRLVRRLCSPSFMDTSPLPDPPSQHHLHTGPAPSTGPYVRSCSFSSPPHLSQPNPFASHRRLCRGR